MYTIAMAYAGTGNNKAIRKLLHVAVSDVNDDVRRAAGTGEIKTLPDENIDPVLGLILGRILLLLLLTLFLARPGLPAVQTARPLPWGGPAP